MKTVAQRILARAAELSEGTPLTAKELLHMGSRAALDQAAAKMAEGLANQHGETVVSHGAAAANALGLTTQVPMRAVYLTSGPNRRLKLGAQMIELRHAPRWQLMFPQRCSFSAR